VSPDSDFVFIHISGQVVQLSQRTLRVIENLARSLKTTQGHSK